MTRNPDLLTFTYAISVFIFAAWLIGVACWPLPKAPKPPSYE